MKKLKLNIERTFPVCARCRHDLLPWFVDDHSKLPPWYLESCEEFFKWLKDKQRKKD
jgi:hypothetical protein